MWTLTNERRGRKRQGERRGKEEVKGVEMSLEGEAEEEEKGVGGLEVSEAKMLYSVTVGGGWGEGKGGICTYARRHTHTHIYC